MQRQAFKGVMRCSAASSVTHTSASCAGASSRLVLGTALQQDQRRGYYRTDKLPTIQIKPEPLPDLGPWLELTLVRPPTEEPAGVRTFLRRLGLSTRQPISYQRDIASIRGMLSTVNHLIKCEPFSMDRFESLRADPLALQVEEAEVETVEDEEEWVRFKREYMANVAAAVKKKEESEKKAALAAAKMAADKTKKKKKK